MDHTVWSNCKVNKIIIIGKIIGRIKTVKNWLIQKINKTRLPLLNTIIIFIEIKTINYLFKRIFRNPIARIGQNHTQEKVRNHEIGVKFLIILISFYNS